MWMYSLLQVQKLLGDGRASLLCYDGTARVGLIRGSMRLRVWINSGDIVLVGLREFQMEKVDIIHKYTTDEARNLQSYGELPANAKINQSVMAMTMDEGDANEVDLNFDFAEI